MLKKNNDNASSQNEVIAKNISAFRKSREKILNQRWPLFAAVYEFDAYHFQKRTFFVTTFDTTDSVKLSKHSSEGSIQAKVGSHIITGVP